MIFYDCPTAPSPRRARIMLHEKSAPHEIINVDLGKGEQLGSQFRKINPACTVPVLKLNDGTIINENAGIAAYLEAAFPQPALLGETPAEKGLVAAWTAKVEFNGLAAVAEALRNSSPALKDRALPGSDNLEQIPALAERGITRLGIFFEQLNEQLEGREFLAIDDFSNADITAVVAVDFARIVKMRPSDEHANIIRWRTALADRPSLQV